jgi:hypothetical protein
MARTPSNEATSRQTVVAQAPATFHGGSGRRRLRAPVDTAAAGRDDAVSTASRRSSRPAGSRRRSSCCLGNGFLWGGTGPKVALRRVYPIPMVVRYDPLVPAPRGTGGLALNVDLAPTFAAASAGAGTRSRGDESAAAPARHVVPRRKDFLIENALNSRGATRCRRSPRRNRRFLYARYLANMRKSCTTSGTSVSSTVSSDPGYGRSC